MTSQGVVLANQRADAGRWKDESWGLTQVTNRY